MEGMPPAVISPPVVGIGKMLPICVFRLAMALTPPFTGLALICHVSEPAEAANTRYTNHGRFAVIESSA
ncbi:hypothetical protein PT7_P002 (plasmid) [Pusillimonas sp. T7-7]|nr:hypothetical protein PT7_P002 [Pusillimonas sp. T7-7]